MGDRTELLSLKAWPEKGVTKEMMNVLPKLPARKEDIFIASYPRSGSYHWQGSFLLKSENQCNAIQDLF